MHRLTKPGFEWGGRNIKIHGKSYQQVHQTHLPMSSPSQATLSRNASGGDNNDQNRSENCADKSSNSRSELEWVFSFRAKVRIVLTWPNRISLARCEVIWSSRGIHRLVTLSRTIRQLVEENDWRLLESSDSDPDDEDQEAPQPSQDPEELVQRWVSFDCHWPHLSFRAPWLCRRNRNWYSFQALVKLIPGFKQKISEPNEILRSLYYTQVSQPLSQPLGLITTNFFLPSSSLEQMLQEAMTTPASNWRSPSGSTCAWRYLPSNDSLQTGRVVVCNMTWWENCYAWSSTIGVILSESLSQPSHIIQNLRQHLCKNSQWEGRLQRIDRLLDQMPLRRWRRWSSRCREGIPQEWHWGQTPLYPVCKLWVFQEFLSNMLRKNPQV